MNHNCVLFGIRPLNKPMGGYLLDFEWKDQKREGWVETKSEITWLIDGYTEE